MNLSGDWTVSNVKQYDNPVQTINDALLQIQRQKKTYSEDLSTIDGAISDLYHDLERDESIDLYKGYLYTMRMKQLHSARRQLKEQNEQIRMFEKNFNVRSSLDSMGRVMLKKDREMPKKRLTRENDILVEDKIQLKNGWKV